MKTKIILTNILLICFVTSCNSTPGMTSANRLHDAVNSDMQNPNNSAAKNSFIDKATYLPTVLYSYYGLIGQTLSPNASKSFKPEEPITNQNQPSKESNK